METPRLYCPLKPTSHPNADAIDKSASEWFRRLALPGDLNTPERLTASRSGVFVANASLVAPEDRLELCSRWYYLGFAIDDRFERNGDLGGAIRQSVLLQRILDYPDSNLLSDDPYANAYRELAREIRELSTAAQYARWVSGYRIYYQCIPWEISNQLDRSTPSLAEQVYIRGANTGASAMCAMLEFCNVNEIPVVEATSPVLQALTEIFSLLLGCGNDLLSFSQEFGEGNAKYNLVTLLMERDQLSPIQAGTQLIHIWNRLMLLFLRVMEQINAHASAALRRCVNDLANMIANVSGWHVGNPRYGSRASDLPEFTDDPSGIDPSPILLPTISWWWSILD